MVVDSMTFDALQCMYGILDSVVLEVLASGSWAVNSGGYTERVALCSGMFVQGVRLPFYSPSRDVLDFLGMTPA